MSDYHDLLADPVAPYDLRLGLEKGVVHAARPPYPELVVVGNQERYVRRTVLQQLKVLASVPEDGKEELIEVSRLVVEVEGGEEIELVRTARPAEQEEEPKRKPDPSTCMACGGPIPYGEGRELDGEFYHKRCVIEDDAPTGHSPRRRVEVPK